MNNISIKEFAKIYIGILLVALLIIGFVNFYTTPAKINNFAKEKSKVEDSVLTISKESPPILAPHATGHKSVLTNSKKAGKKKHSNKSVEKKKISKRVRKVEFRSYSGICGARTRNGRACQRVVKGGGRCYQH